MTRPDRLWRVAGAVLLATLVVTGCDSAGALPGGSNMDRTEELKSRPSYEQGAADYVAMLDEMKAAITKSARDLRWRTEASVEDNWAGCAEPYSDIEGAETGTFHSGNADGSISDQAWPQVKQAVIGVAAQHGFTEVQSLKDGPGEHMLVIRNKQEGSVELGSLVNTTLVVYGSCLLRAAPRPS